MISSILHSCDVFNHGEAPNKILAAEYLFILHHYKARLSIVLGEFELIPKIIKLMKGYYHEFEETQKLTEKANTSDIYDGKSSSYLYSMIAQHLKTLKSEIVP